MKNNYMRLPNHISEEAKSKVKTKPESTSGFWAKPGIAATLSMWSAIACIAFSVWVIYPKNETVGMFCEAFCCMWAGACLVRAEKQKKDAKKNNNKDLKH